MSEFARCGVCRRMLLPGVEEQRSVCEMCARDTGAVVMPPPRRRASPCARCNHTTLIRVVPRELGRDSIGPMFVTYSYPFDANRGLGMLELYICKACGFTEWYCQRPDEIPIGPEYMTEEVDLEAGGPYR